MNLTLEHITKQYASGKVALQDICLELQSPGMIGLLGPNGAGKSTMMQLLVAGLLPSSGEIRLDGIPLRQQQRQLKSALGYLPQRFGLYEELTVEQFLDYMAALKNCAGNGEQLQQVLEQTGLTGQRKKKISTLSGGQRQRVGIAQALLGSPQLLILDEPTVGLDPEERIRFRNLFAGQATDKIVLLSTHIIEDVQSICNRLIVLYEGRILFDGAPWQLQQQADGHVALMDESMLAYLSEPYWVTGRQDGAQGVRCRVVCEQLPDFAQPAEPTLEDGYLYVLHQGGRQNG